MPATGAISDRVRDILPWTWDALLQNTDKYGPDSLQRRIDYVKARIFGAAAHPEEDESNYSILMMDYLAKLSALQLIPAGIEHWGNASSSVTTNGYAGAETATYPDRIKALEDLRKLLMEEVAELGPIVAPEIPDTGTLRRSSSPRVNTSHLDEITRDPQEFELPGVPWNANNRPVYRPATIGR